MPIWSASPIGSPDEILELGLSLAEWGSCSPRDEQRSVGCDSYDICPWKGPRPKNIPWRIIKQTMTGVGTRRGWSPCFDALRVKDRIEQNGGSFKIIGQEGDTITVTSEVRRHRDGDPIGQTSFMLEKQELVVPKFPLAKDRPSLMDKAELMAERQEREKELDRAKDDRLLGLAPVAVGFEIEREETVEATRQGADQPQLGGQSGNRPGQKPRP